MYGEQGFKAFHKTVHLITEIYRQRLLNFFSSAYITPISTKDIKYSMIPIRSWPHNKQNTEQTHAISGWC